MSKRYITSGKPKFHHGSIIVTPERYRAPLDIPKETNGQVLVRRRGFSTLATPVVTRSITEHS